MRCAGHIACMGDKRNAYNILAEEPKGKGSFGRCRAYFKKATI
jgi:hypothetical protein